MMDALDFKHIKAKRLHITLQWIRDIWVIKRSSATSTNTRNYSPLKNSTMNTTPRKFYDGMAGMPAPGQIDKKMTPMEELIEQLKKLSPESPMGNDVSKAFHGGIQLAILKAKFLLEAEREYASQQAPASTPPVSANDAALMDVDKPDGVYAVNLSWGINYHPTDLSKVMKAKDCLFIGTGKECADFIYKNKPAPVSAMEDGWVDVRNALPDNEGLYLAWVTNHSFLGPPESFFIVYYGFANDEDATEMFWSYMMKPIDVTHWRPLPPPPSNR